MTVGVAVELGACMGVLSRALFSLPILPSRLRDPCLKRGHTNH